MALVCITHRLGRKAFIAELERLAEPGETRAEREAVTEQLLGFPLDAAQKYFSLYFQGVRLEDVAEAFGRLM